MSKQHDMEDPLLDVVRALEYYARGENDPAVAQAALAKFMPIFPCRVASDHIGLEPGQTHVYDFIDDAYPTKDKNTSYARFVLFYLAAPSSIKYLFTDFMDCKLFATFNGERYRVTGASTLGDVFITKDFEEWQGYTDRVLINELSEFCKTPEYVHEPHKRSRPQDDPEPYNPFVAPATYVSSDLNEIRRSLGEHHHGCTPIQIVSANMNTGERIFTTFVDFFRRPKFADRYFWMRDRTNKNVIGYGYQSPELEITLHYGQPTEEFLAIENEYRTLGDFV